MSATGRGARRHPDDFYATPGWATRAILPLLGEPRTILEPCAGEGAIMDECRARWPRASMLAVELDKDRADAVVESGHRAVCDDFLTMAPWSELELIITNPPFKLAQEFILHALPMADTVCMLLRLNFLGSQRRAEFWHQHPCGVYVLPKRPSFTGKGTDAIEYAWFVWGDGHANRWDVLEIDLALQPVVTPQRARRAGQVPLFGGGK